MTASTLNPKSVTIVENWFSKNQRISLWREEDFGYLSKIVVWACNEETQERVCLNSDQNWKAFYECLSFGFQNYCNGLIKNDKFGIIPDEYRKFVTLVNPAIIPNW